MLFMTGYAQLAAAMPFVMGVSLSVVVGGARRAVADGVDLSAKPRRWRPADIAASSWGAA
jgi:transposase